MTMSPLARLRPAVLLVAAVALTGCASMSEKDPYEGYNRSMFAFNDAVDTHALKPVATAYKNVTPSFVQTGVSNFFGNLGDVWSSANNFMQGKGERGLNDFTRVMINSFFGLGGLLDIASEAGIPRTNEDFGQTLGYWGMPSGPYVMLPLLGPSTLRDTAALPVDIAADPWGYKVSNQTRNIGTVVRVIDQRAGLLDATNLLEEAALDRYEFIRDGYLQQRQNKVFDGEGSRKAAQEARAEASLSREKSIKSSYEDDPGPTAAPAEAAGATPAASAVSSESAPKELTAEVNPI